MRRIVVMLTVGALMALMLVVSAMPAFAVASSQASCNGIGGSTQAILDGPGSTASCSSIEPQDITTSCVSLLPNRQLGAVGRRMNKSEAPHLFGVSLSSVKRYARG